jgi:hypothetical protein
VTTKEANKAPAAHGTQLRELLQSLERWLRTSPRQISLVVVLMTVGTLFVQDQVHAHLWLVFTYSFPVALAGSGWVFKGASRRPWSSPRCSTTTRSARSAAPTRSSS